MSTARTKANEAAAADTPSNVVTDPVPDHRPAGPFESEAQIAAGPHRPEPATPVRQDPGVVANAPTRPTRGHARITVRATQNGYYGDARRRTGDVFVITDEKDFSKKWMVRVSDETPERRTTGQDVIQREHDDILASRARGPAVASPDNPLGASRGAGGLTDE